MTLAYLAQKSNSQAVYWYRKAADHGNERASFFLAMRYEYGFGGVHKNIQSAIRYYEIAKNDASPITRDTVNKALADLKGKLEHHGNH